MSEEQPITDAIRESLALNPGPRTTSVSLEIDISLPNEGFIRSRIYLPRNPDDPFFGAWDSHDNLKNNWHEDGNDMASAIRLVADALSRDPTRRALEIAATEISDATGMSPRDEAARLLEQAENEAAEPEELVLTDDMLERMRKRCIHGR